LQEKHTEKVPKSMEEKYSEIVYLTDTFCEEKLNEEYTQLIRSTIAALCRKRPSPLSKGKAKTWACGAVHAVGTVNFLFDKSQTPSLSVSDIYNAFDIAKSTAQSKSKTIRDLLKMSYTDYKWVLPSRLADNPTVWMLSVNGLIVDIRDLPTEVQIQAYEQGIIPYVPNLQ
jgi:hypothetical protein